MTTKSEIADDISGKLPEGEGLPVPRVLEVAARYRVNKTTAHKALRLLDTAGLIKRKSAAPADGYVTTGQQGSVDPAAAAWHRYRTTGCLWPSAGKRGQCPVLGCGRALRNVPRPVYGYACSTCIQTGAVLSGRSEG